MRHIVRRASAGIVGSLLVLGALVACGSDDDASSGPTDASTGSVDTPAIDDGVAWLDGQLTHGVLHDDQYHSDDISTTVEAAYALMALDADPATVQLMTKAIEKGAKEYADPGKEVYAGPTGKLVAFAIDTGHDPSSFGGVDLLAQLEDRTADKGPLAGRTSDLSTYGDYANTLGQTWAVRGLLEAGSDEAPAALGFLLEQQCQDGSLRQDFAKPTAKDQTCDAGPHKPSTDATALFVVLLSDLTDQDPRIGDAVDAATAWLVAHQGGDGSFEGGGRLGPNTNSTGLSAWALHIAGEDRAAANAGEWVRAHQVDHCKGALAGEAGAIAYDDAALKDAAHDGITTKTAYQWRLATAQALPALLAAPADAPPAPCPGS